MRLLCDLLLLLGIFSLSLWLVCIIAVVSLFIFEDFYEIIFLGIISDILYGVPIHYLPIPVAYTVLTSLFFIAKVVLRKHLKFYSN